MKRISIYLTAIMALASCGKAEFNTNNDLAREGLKGPVESYYEVEVYFGARTKNPKERNSVAEWVRYYNEQGNLSALEYIDEEWGFFYEYSESGLLQSIKTIDHADGEEVEKSMEYRYDSNGRLLAVDEVKYRYDGSTRLSPGVKTYTYEELPNGALIRREFDDNYKPRLWKIDITNAPKGSEMDLFEQYGDERCDVDIYDVDGNLVLAVAKSYNDMSGRRYIYDSKGKVESVEGLYMKYGYDGKYEINDKGDIELKVVYSNTGEANVIDKNEYEYEYDKYGNWTSMKIKSEDGDGTYYYLYTRTFTYYE